MKYINTLIVVIFLTTVSCLSHRTSHKTSDLSYTSGREEVMAAGQWLYQVYGLDSSEMMWQFRTDAPFVYHPDTGLRAQNGWLQLRAQTARQWHIYNDSSSLAVYHADSLTHTQEQVISSERKPVRKSRFGWIIALSILIGGLIWWMFRRR